MGRNNMRLTTDEMQKYHRAVELQKKEIWEKSKKNKYRKSCYYSPPIQKQLGSQLSEWWLVYGKWVEFVLSFIIAIIIYYFVF